MYTVVMCTDAHGYSQVEDLLKSLTIQSATNKRAYATLNKFVYSISRLEQLGTRSGEKFTKHICNGIWELRVNQYRVFFITGPNKRIYLLHAFEKQTKKTPELEKERAIKEAALIRESFNNHEHYEGD